MKTPLLKLTLASLCLMTAQANAETHDHKGHKGGHEHSKCGVHLGPNKGRMLKKTNTEIVINKDNSISLHFLNDKKEVIEPTETRIMILVSGKPIKLSKKEKSYTTAAQKFPATVHVKIGKKIEKVKIDTSDCKKCNNQQYTCTCHNHSH